MADETKMMRQIRSALTLAENASTEGERDAAMSRAMHLMETAGIDEAMVEASRAKSEKRDKVGKMAIEFDGQQVNAKYELLTSVAFAHDLRVLVHRYGRAITGITLMGWESDLQLVSMMYTSLLLQQTSMLDVSIREEEPGWYERGQKTIWRRTWMRAFAHRVAQRIAQARRAAIAQHDRETASSGSGSAALVVVTRKQAVENAYNEEYGDLKTRKTRKLAYNNHGAESGRAAGDRAALGGTSIGRNGQRQLGGG